MSPAESNILDKNLQKIGDVIQEVAPPELQHQAPSDFNSVMANSSKVVEAQITEGKNTTGGQGVLHNRFNIQKFIRSKQ